MLIPPGSHLFVGVNESGLNHLLDRVFAKRAHYITYGTPRYVLQSTSAETQVPAVTFPGIPGGIEYRVAFANVKTDIYPVTTPGDPFGDLKVGEFLLAAAGEIKLLVRLPFGGQKESETPFQVWARGELLPGKIPDLVLSIVAVKVTGVAGPFIGVVEAILHGVLQSAIGSVSIPIQPLTVNAITIMVKEQPTLADDQIKILGTL